MLYGCVWYVCCYVGKKALVVVFSSVFAITERRDIGLYEVPLSVSLLGFWDRDYVSQLPCVWYYVFC